MIKAIFTDIDGTLKNSNGEITDYTKETLKRCKLKRLQIILVSGRSRQNMLKFIKQLDVGDYLISSNGADIYDIKNDRTVFSSPIEKKNIKLLYEYAKENDFNIKLNYEDKLAINKAFYPDEYEVVKSEEEIMDILNNNDVVQCVLMNQDINKIKEFKNYFYANFADLKIENESKKLTDESLPAPKTYYCDVINKTVSKGNAVEKLINQLFDSTQEVVTIGDGENDISMFKTTINSVAMGNSSQYVKSCANYETKTNDEDGWAYMINQILDNKK